MLSEIKKEWSGGKPIRLMFQDEARFGRISDPRRCWAPRPIRPMCKSLCIREYTYVYSAVEAKSGEVDSLILPYADSKCMQIFLSEVGARHAHEKMVIVLDGASGHTSSSLSIPENIRLLHLPPYAPELNPVEHLWDELREKFFHNKVFDSLRLLEMHLVKALQNVEKNPDKIKSIVAWDWIINALLI